MGCISGWTQKALERSGEEKNQELSKQTGPTHNHVSFKIRTQDYLCGGSLGCVAIRNSSPWVLARLGLVLAQRSKLTRLLLVFFLVALRYGMLRKPGKCLVIKHLEFFFKREHV